MWKSRKIKIYSFEKTVMNCLNFFSFCVTILSNFWAEISKKNQYIFFTNFIQATFFILVEGLIYAVKHVKNNVKTQQKKHFLEKHCCWFLYFFLNKAFVISLIFKDFFDYHTNPWITCFVFLIRFLPIQCKAPGQTTYTVPGLVSKRFIEPGFGVSSNSKGCEA